jgi:xylitol oxidase
MTMQNWAGNVTFGAAGVERPTSVQAVQQVVANARRVRALGTGHSFNRIADTTGTLVSLSELPPIMEVDTRMQMVRVSGGLRYGDLGPVLREAGLALPNTGSLPHISVAGTVATGTHGSGAGNPILAAGVRELTVVTADGDLVTVDRESRPDEFDGWVLSLGRLGVVVELVLDLVPEFEIAQTVVEDVDETIVGRGLTSVLGSSYSVSIFTDWRGRGNTQVWVKDRMGETPGWAGFPLWGGRPADGPRHPLAGMPVEHATVQLGQPGPWLERLPHFRLDFLPSSGDELQSEYFVAERHATEAWTTLTRLSDVVAPALQVSEVRAVAADPLWLSPTRGEQTVAFHFTWVSDPDVVRPAVEAVESELAAFDARPHWGKVFGTTPARLAELYPRLEDFADLAARVDPGGKLGNELVDSWLGPAGQGPSL